MALAESPQSKSLQLVTIYQNDGKNVSRKSTFADVDLNATVDNLNAAGNAIASLKSESLSGINTVTTCRIVNA